MPASTRLQPAHGLGPLQSLPPCSMLWWRQPTIPPPPTHAHTPCPPCAYWGHWCREPRGYTPAKQDPLEDPSHCFHTFYGEGAEAVFARSRGRLL